MNDRMRSAGESVTGKSIDKVPTRIAGIDTILRGGLPKGRMTLLVGGPGTGKTNIALEFLYRSALAGEPGLLVAFEERAEAIRRNAASLGWDLAPLEEQGKLFIFEARVPPQTVVSGDFTFKPLLAILEGQAKAIGARLIVIDAMDVPLRLFTSPERERAELYALHDWLSDFGMTSIVTAKTGEAYLARYEFLDYMANTVVWLDQRVEKQSSTRRLRVIKYRGSSYDRNEYPYVISERGTELLPITSARLSHRIRGEHFSSGLPELDRMLGGGFLRASCTLITGTSGTGKTLLASTLSRAACDRGEKVLYISFEETQEGLTTAILNAGVDLGSCAEAGLFRVHTVLPEAMGGEEHLLEINRLMQECDPAHVILDAASSAERFRGETAPFEFLVRFITLCKEQGRTSVLTNQLSGIENVGAITGLGISSIVDTVVLLRYLELQGEFIRNLAVFKSRGSKHSNQYREFRITDHGLEFPGVFLGEGGVVAGIARQEQEAREAIEKRRMERQLHAKEAEIAQLRAALEAQTAEFKARIELAEADVETMRLEQDLRRHGREERERMRGGNGQ